MVPIIANPGHCRLRQRGQNALDCTCKHHRSLKKCVLPYIQNFLESFFRHRLWDRNSGTLRVAPAESPRFAPLERHIDYAKNPGILTRLRYAHEHIALLQGCLIRAMRPSGDYMRASKPVDHSDHIVFSNEQARISPDPPAHGSGGRRSLEYPTSEGLSPPNSHGVGSHEPHRMLCF